MYDIVIIGAGVSGCAIARELSRYRAKVLVVEKEEDVCCGTSKANSAIVHAGFDAATGSLMAKMNVEGNRLMEQLSIDLDFPFEGPRRTEFGLLMVPGEVRGEGQYVAALVKGSSLNKTESEDVYVPEFQFFDKNDEIYALPLHVASDMPLLGKRLKVLNAGVHAFTVKGKNRIPYADLALCPILQDDDFPDVALSTQDTLRFLHKDAIRLSSEAPEGYLTVSYEGYKLGFVKNLGNRANNLHPAARRIMMNVE